MESHIGNDFMVYWSFTHPCVVPPPPDIVVEGSAKGWKIGIYVASSIFFGCTNSKLIVNHTLMSKYPLGLR